MESILTLIGSILANVIAYYISKWIDNKLEDRRTTKKSRWWQPAAFLVVGDITYLVSF